MTGAEAWGVAAKVDGLVVESWRQNWGRRPFGSGTFALNGEVQWSSNDNVQRSIDPVHLPNGLHYWHHGKGLCVLKEGQFLLKHEYPYTLTLFVPKKVQADGGICYDTTNKDQPYWQNNPQLGRIMKDMRVPVQPGFMTQQTTEYKNWLSRRDG